MAKTRNRYVCEQCGRQSAGWLGRCPGCGAWDSFSELAAPAPGTPARSGTRTPGAFAARARELPEVCEAPRLSAITGESRRRTSTGIAELDRVLGGGLVEGSVILVGGDPGIGKSTLMLQASEGIAAAAAAVSAAGALAELPVLYCTAEESLLQTRRRARRLGVTGESVAVIAENTLENILAQLDRLRPVFGVIDSIQAIGTPEVASAPGSVSQVRECAGRLITWAKRQRTALVLVGHVTKSGELAGPRVLEHMVDTVLYFEGDRFHHYRLLRAVKNRFGSTAEIGVFAMAGDGLQEVENPSALFLESSEAARPGSAIVACVEGTRTLLVEVQALVTRATGGLPRRKVTGLDQGRVEMLLAVLEKRLRLPMGQQDVYVNVVGGMRLVEPAADLGVALAIVSSLREQPLPASTVIMGEVGLGGEVRAISQVAARLSECAKLGFTHALVPRHTREQPPQVRGLTVESARNLGQALAIAAPSTPRARDAALPPKTAP